MVDPQKRTKTERLTETTDDLSNAKIDNEQPTVLETRHIVIRCKRLRLVRRQYLKWLDSTFKIINSKSLSSYSTRERNSTETRYGTPSLETYSEPNLTYGPKVVFVTGCDLNPYWETDTSNQRTEFVRNREQNVWRVLLLMWKRLDTRVVH